MAFFSRWQRYRCLGRGLPWYGYDYTCDDVTLWQRNGTDVAPGSPCKPLGGTRGAGARQAPYWEQMDILHSNMTRVTTGLIYNHTTVSVHYVRRSPCSPRTWRCSDYLALCWLRAEL